MVNISRALLPTEQARANVLRRLPDGSFVLDREEEERRRKAALDSWTVCLMVIFPPLIFGGVLIEYKNDLWLIGRFCFSKSA